METHLSDLTVSLRRRRRGNERKPRFSEIPGVGKGLTLLVSESAQRIRSERSPLVQTRTATAPQGVVGFRPDLDRLKAHEPRYNMVFSSRPLQVIKGR